MQKPGVVVFGGSGHCPHCQSVVSKLQRAGVEHQYDEQPGHMYNIVQALDVQARPVTVLYVVGDGPQVDRLIEAAKGL